MVHGGAASAVRGSGEVGCAAAPSHRQTQARRAWTAAGHEVGLVERVGSLLPLHEIDRDHQAITPGKRHKPDRRQCAAV